MHHQLQHNRFYTHIRTTLYCIIFIASICTYWDITPRTIIYLSKWRYSRSFEDTGKTSVKNRACLARGWETCAAPSPCTPKTANELWSQKLDSLSRANSSRGNSLEGHPIKTSIPRTHPVKNGPGLRTQLSSILDPQPGRHLLLSHARYDKDG